MKKGDKYLCVRNYYENYRCYFRENVTYMVDKKVRSRVYFVEDINENQYEDEFRVKDEALLLECEVPLFFNRIHKYTYGK